MIKPAVRSNRRASYSWLLALLIPAFAAVIALTNPIEEHAFDAAAFHVYRGVVFSDALRDGGLYPRWVMPINGGLGGPLFSFYSPLAYYVMDALHRVGLPHTIGWRVLVALSLIGASAGMYLLGLKLFRRADLALVAAACFTYAPYLLRDFFERGAPQGPAITLYPWLLWALLRLAERPSGPRLTFAALIWAGVLLMHNLSALLVLPILALFCLFIAMRYGLKSVRLPILALIVGLLLSAFHVLPFVVDSSYVQLNSASQDPSTRPAENPVSFADLMAWPAVLDTAVDNNTTGYGVGLLHVLITAAGVGIALLLWRRHKVAEALFVALLSIFGLLMLWMQLESATQIWSAFPALDILQFRIRLLNTAGLIAAILIGYIFVVLPLSARLHSIVSAVLITVFIGTQLPLLYPQLFHRYTAFPLNPTVADAQTWAFQNHVPGLTLTTSAELLPKWRNTLFSEAEVRKIAASPVDNMPPGGHILETTRHASDLEIKLDSPTPFNAALHLMYFPGWQGTLNGQPQQLRPMDVSGYTLLNVPAGTSTISLHYAGTDAQHAGDLISALAALALLVMVLLPFSSACVGKRGWGIGGQIRSPQPILAPITYLTPLWWLPIVIIALLLLKAVWLDPNTTLFRRTSTCETSAVFAGNIHLCGYDVSSAAVHPGDSLRVMLSWELDHIAPDPAYTFVHVLGSAFNPATNNPIWSQEDKQEPGTFPVQDWVTGKILQDVYDLRVPPNAPPGDYQLEIGWYSPDNNRLKPEITSASGAVSRSELDSVFIAKIAVR